MTATITIVEVRSLEVESSDGLTIALVVGSMTKGVVVSGIFIINTGLISWNVSYNYKYRIQKQKKI